MVAVLFGGPFCQDDIDKFIDTCTRRAGRVGLWNDHLAHEDNGSVLVRIECAQRVSGRGMRVLKKGEKLGDGSRGNGTRGKKFQDITPLHRTSLNRYLSTD